MALPHASHLDVINVAPLGEALHGTVSTSLIKTDRIQLLHLVLAHKPIGERGLLLPPRLVVRRSSRRS